MVPDNDHEYKYPFELLTEKASQDDLFENQSHRNIADSIFKTIHITKSGINIGLHGDFGSGKTTVISILQKINPYNNIKYFYFDSWAHRDEPLRKVFLEELSSDIIVNEKYKKKTKNWLRYSVSTEITKLKPYQKSARIKYLLATPFIALGVALFLKNDLNEICLGLNCGPLNWNLTIGLLLIFNTIITVIASHFQYLKNRIGKSNSEIRKKWQKYFNPNIFLGNEKGITKTKSENLTSLEFRDKFIEIISEWERENESSKLVFIIDNLDRVDHEAKSILSSLQLFFQHRNGVKQDTKFYQNIYVLIPHNNRLGSMEPAEYIEFEEKFFQVSFDIPQPLPMNWDKIFDIFFKICFKDDNQWGESKKDIKDVYNFYYESVNSAFNPRLIKSYLNQIAILRNHLVETEIAIKHICYYILLRKNKPYADENYDSISKDLQNAKYPLDKHLHFLLTEELISKQDVIKILAAIHFNVNKDHSYEVLLSSAINSCLFDSIQNESKQLSKLEKNHGNSFWYVFDNYISKINSNNFLNAAYVISNNFQENNQKAYALSIRFNSLSYQTLNDERLFLGSETSFKLVYSVFNFLNRTNQEKLWQSIVRQFIDAVRKEINPIKLEFAIDNNDNLYSQFELSNVEVDTPFFNISQWQVIAKYWHIKSPNLINYVVPTNNKETGSSLIKLLSELSYLGEENLMVIKYFVESNKVDRKELYQIYKHFIQSYLKQKIKLQDHYFLTTLAYYLTKVKKTPDFFSINGFEKYLSQLLQLEEKENRFDQLYLLNFTLSSKYGINFIEKLEDSGEVKRRIMLTWLNASDVGLEIYVNCFMNEITNLSWLYSFFAEKKFELAYRIAEEYIERDIIYLFNTNFKIEQFAFLSLQLWERGNVSMSKYFSLLKNVRDISKIKEEVSNSNLKDSQKESFNELIISQGITN